MNTPAPHKKNLKKKGFTILEVTVAIGIFSVLMVLAVDITLRILDLQKKAGYIQAVLDNARLSLELMTREMRTGTNFSLVALPCPNIMGNGIQFTDVNQSPAQRRYYYLADRDSDGKSDTIMRIAMSSDIAADCTETRPFTATEVTVNKLNFILTGASSGPNDGQPRITINLNIKLKSAKAQLNTATRLQTTVVPRLRDL